jgi:hypothetical protein
MLAFVRFRSKHVGTITRKRSRLWTDRGEEMLRLSGGNSLQCSGPLPIVPATEGGSPETPEEFQVPSASRRNPRRT